MKNRQVFLTPFFLLLTYIIGSSIVISRYFQLAPPFYCGLVLALILTGLLIFLMRSFGQFFFLENTRLLQAEKYLKPGIYFTQFHGFYGGPEQLMFYLWPAKLELETATGRVSAKWEPCPKVFVFYEQRLSAELAAACRDEAHSMRSEIHDGILLWKKDDKGVGTLSFHPKTAEIQHEARRNQMPTPPVETQGEAAPAS